MAQARKIRRKFGARLIADRRDRKFLIRRQTTTLTSRYWYADGWWGDQGNTSQCVGYGFAHWLEDGPVTHGGKAPCLAPSVIYREAQRIDEWPGENYEGTSVRAGAKVLQSRGFIREYRWAFTIDAVINALLTQGPLVVGTSWLEGMLETDADGFVHAEGEEYGGHCWVLNGVNTTQKKLRGKNSWGRTWGKRGSLWISIADFAKLLRADGEVCLAIEADPQESP